MRYIFLTFFIFSFFNNDHIEKCSESKGMKPVLFFFNSLLINSHPQIIDSLFAIAKLLENFIICIDGSRPSIPEIAFIVKNDFFLYFLNTFSIDE